jgi:hypothetical protein
MYDGRGSWEKAMNLREFLEGRQRVVIADRH